MDYTMTIVRNPKNSIGFGIIRGYRNPKVTDSTAKQGLVSTTHGHFGYA